ncbi:hypothetical protein BH11PSE11_BH11PSE11_12280 [soil metagenome]
MKLHLPPAGKPAFYERQSMKALERFTGKIWGMPLQVFQIMGETDPDAKALSDWMSKAPDIMNRRRAIVRQMQLTNLMKAK